MRKVILLLLAEALTAAAQSNFAGFWLSTEREYLMRKIEQKGDLFEFTARSGNGTQSFTATLGKETALSIGGLQVTTAVQWDGAVLVVHINGVANGTDVKQTMRYSLSSDGNMLTAAFTRGQPEIMQTQTYTRKTAADWEKEPPKQLAEEAYKNIQLLKGQTTAELLAFMQRITAALNVSCTYCHVTGHFERDEKPAKATARKMITMVRAIDTQNFPSSNAVTCWTCHRGAEKPQSAPPPK